MSNVELGSWYYYVKCEICAVSGMYNRISYEGLERKT